jgi:hypothetical protein
MATWLMALTQSLTKSLRIMVCWLMNMAIQHLI